MQNKLYAPIANAGETVRQRERKKQLVAHIILILSPTVNSSGCSVGGWALVLCGEVFTS